MTELHIRKKGLRLVPLMGHLQDGELRPSPNARGNGWTRYSTYETPQQAERTGAYYGLTHLDYSWRVVPL